MNSDTVLKALIGSRDPAMLEFLSPSIRARLEALPAYNIAPSAEEPLNEVHWSWFLATLKALTPLEQSFCLSLVPSPQLTAEPLSLTPLGRAYLGQFLFQPLSDGYLPLSWLPPSPLLPLARHSKRQLEHLIDHLALYDLALAMRQVVDTQVLKKIRAQLSEPQLNLLKQFSQTANPSPYPTLELPSSDLPSHLHRRGLLHLAAALSREPPALLWHIVHRLDIGRGTLLCKLADNIPASLASWSANKILSLFP